MPTFHAKLSASGTKEWANCPGALAVKEMFPLPDSANEASLLGTAIHGLVERCLIRGEHPTTYLGQTINLLSDESVTIAHTNANVEFQTILTQELIDAAAEPVEYVNQRLHELLPTLYPSPTNTANSKLAISNRHLWVEQWSNSLPERDDAGGTADITIAIPYTEIEVVDYKNGSGVFVPVTKNWQLRSYLLGMALKDDFEFDRFSYTISQPRHHMSTGIMSEEISLEELTQFQGTLREAAERVDKARSILDKHKPTTQHLALHTLHDNNLISATGLAEESNGAHCTFCPYIGQCPSAYANTAKVAAMDFDDDPEPIAIPSSVQQLANILRWEPFITKFLKQAKADAERLALSGTKIPGKKLVAKSANRKWASDKSKLNTLKLAEEIAEKYEIEVNTITTDPGILTGVQIEKLIPKEKRKEFNSLYLYKPEAGFVLADESDKRKEYVPRADAKDDFRD